MVTPGGMAQCSTPLVTPLPALVTTRPTIGARRNYGPGGTMFDYSDTIRQTGTVCTHAGTHARRH